MAKKMKAAVLYGQEDVRTEEIDIPTITDDEVLVKVKVALTCGTDAKVYLRGGHPKMIKPPAVFGHEWAGEVVETGAKVKDFPPGTPVVAANSVPCFQCFYCQRKELSLCENLLFLNGAYAEYIKVPAPIVKTNLFQIPLGISFREAALLEPLSCALHGLERIKVSRGEEVVISGGGPIGLLFLLLCKYKGAKVTVGDKMPERLEIARQLGADVVLNAEVLGDNYLAEIRKINNSGEGADLAIEAVGNPRVWELSLDMVRKGGRVLLFGGCRPGTTFEVDTKLLHYSELTLKGVFHHTPHYVKKAFELITGRALNLAPLITHQLPLSRLPEALHMITSKEGIKIAVIPD